MQITFILPRVKYKQKENLKGPQKNDAQNGIFFKSIAATENGKY
jgi:hypothetical protein